MENRDHGRRSIRNGSIDRMLARSSASRRNDEDEEALKWAALEKLPTCDRLRTTIWKNYEGGRLIQQQIDVRQMSPIHWKILIDNLIKVTEEDNETFLKKLRHRIDRVGIQLPTIDVRFENLTVNAKCYVGSRATPTLWNAMRNAIENMLNGLGISTAKRRAVTILKDVSGIIKPGRMTLLLGPPSSGKTTLLLALAGKLDQEGIKLEGKITYNGYELHEFVPPKTSAYISQHDLHTGEMTVRETLEFSARCQGVGTRYELLSEISKREKQAGIFPDAAIDMYMKAAAMEAVQSSIITDYTMKILGLDTCADILIGDEMRRGISGGQKKRVTTGEMIVGPTKTLFMDEISTGLDSSTTYQIVKCLQQFVHVLEGTILMSLLQPAPEVFELFDDIILLSDGQIVYHGPRENVIEYFEDCGFVCPGRKSTADFLQEVISKRDQEKYWHNRWKPYRYVSAAEFCQRFKHMKEGKKLAADISQPYDKKKSHAAALVFERYSVDNWTLFKIGFAREWLLLKRNSFIYIFRGMQIFIVAFAAITVFLRTRMYQRNIADATLYMGALFFSIVMIMFNGFAELPLTLARLPVFFKQRDLLFYPAWVFTLPTFVLGLPIAILESGTWSLLTYYAEGFSPEPSRFFKYFLVLFLVHIMASSLFRLIASIFRTMEIASTAGSFILLVIFTLGGFVISKGKIPRWWIWGYWISPLTYAENAISVNEFLAPRWIQVMDQTGPLGIEVLQTKGIVPREYWYWIGIGALFGFIILFNVVLTWALASLKPLGSRHAVMSKETLAESEEGKHDMDYIRSRALPSKEGNKLDGTALQISGGAHKQGLILPFTPLAISFDDVCYYVDMPVAMKEQGVHETKLKLLSDISGAFRPGILTSLMGVSGAGKTTLMDVLAGRKTTGYIEGRINISGFPKKQETFARVSGYCEQNDVHSPQLTVYESLVFSAWLRLPEEIEHDRKMQFVTEVIELVELDSLRDAIIGIPGLTGLSTEQRKRLTIAVELVANPSIIFMDEPTSGLDARAAAIVMRTVRNTVDTGRTVVCTIHQPSIDIFESSDELLLLKRGGQMIYSGQLGRHSHKLIEYFEAIPGVPKIGEGINPATWMLDVTSESSEQRLGIDFSDIYKESPQYRSAKQMVKDLGIPIPGSKDIYFPTRYALSTYQQFQACLWKQYWTYWRSPKYNGVRFFFTLFSAFLFGSIFWNAGKSRSTQQDLFNVIGAAYASTMFLGINNCASVQPVVSTERTVFYRERAAGMYAALPYGLAQVIIEVPYIFIQTTLYASITYSMISFEWKAEKFFWYCFTMFFTFMYFTYYGMMAVSLTPNYNVAAIMASSFYALFNLFAGFIIPRPRIPKWWIWYYWICPVAWTIYGLIVSQYGDVTDLLQIPGAQSIPIKDFVRSFFGYDRAFLGVVAAVLAGFTLFFSFIFIICIKCLNFQQR